MTKKLAVFFLLIGCGDPSEDQADAGAVCALGTTRCVPGQVTSVETCTAAGWERSTCDDYALCSAAQCRPACDLTAVPAYPTLCVVPNGDSVNSSELALWSDPKLAVPTWAIGGARNMTEERAPIMDVQQPWPYAWFISDAYAALVAFRLDQFSQANKQRITIRAKRSDLFNAATSYDVAVFNQTGVIGRSQFGPIAADWETRSFINEISLQRDGSWNSMGVSPTAPQQPVDPIVVNYIKFTIEPL